VRVHDDAKEAVGSLFQGPFMLGVKVTELLLKAVAAYPQTFVLATLAVVALGTAMVFANTTAIPGLITGTIQLVGSVRLLGQVMMSTASLIQGAAATSVVWTVGWAAVVIAIGAVIFALSRQTDAAEAANKITTTQIEKQAQVTEASKKLADEAHAVAAAQEGSADRHEKLNAILGHLDPSTRVYVDALKEERVVVAALNRDLDSTAAANKGVQESLVVKVSAGILQQLDDIQEKKTQISLLQERVNRAEIEGDAATVRSGREAIVTLQFGLEAWDRTEIGVTKLNEQLTENEAKLLLAAKAGGVSRDRFLELNLAAGVSRDRLTQLGVIWDALTPTINKTNDALKQQALDLKGVKDALKALLETGDLQIETKILDIVKQKVSATQAKRLAQDALKDPAFAQVVAERKQYTEAEKAARAVFEPPDAKTTRDRGDALKIATDAVHKLRQEVEALQRGGGLLFDLEVKKSDLEATKQEYEEIFKLRHKMQFEVGAAIPVEQVARQAVLRDLQRENSARQEILKISEQDLDNAAKIKVLDYQNREARLTLVGFDERHEKAMRTLIALKAGELDLSTQVLDAAAKTKAIQEWFLARGGVPTLGQKKVSPALDRSISDQAILFNESTAQAAMTAAQSFDAERERQTQLTTLRYDESLLRRRITQEEATARFKAENDVDEEIKRISQRLTLSLISDEKMLALARAKAVEDRRKQVQSSEVDVQLLLDQLDRLGRGDSQETSIAANNYLKTLYGNMVSVRQELVAIRDLGGVQGIVGSAEFDKAQKEQFVLNQLHERIDLNKQVAQTELQIANGPYNESLRVRAALLQETLSLQRRDEDAIIATNKAQLDLADSTTYHATQANAKVLEFLASQKSITQIVADAKTGVIQTTYDYITSGLDKINTKLGGLGKLLTQIEGDFIKLALNKFFLWLMGGQGASGQSSSGGSGGGLGGILNFLFGGGGGGANSRAATASQFGGGAFANGGNAFTSGFAGSSGIPQALTGSQAFDGLGLNVAALGSGFGGGIEAPTTTLSSQVAQQSAAGWGGVQNAAVGAGSVAAGGSSSLSSSFGAMLPFLGLSAGMQLGGQSRFGNVAGGVGGLLAGGIGAAFLTPGLFATTGILGSMGPAIAALLTNPFTIAAAGALIIGAILLGRNAQRRKDETTRAQLNGDVYTQVIQILNAVRAGSMTGAEAMSQYNTVKTNYFAGVAQMKDSKTKRIATDWWNNDFDPVYRPLIEQAGKASDEAKARAGKLVPEFATGGYVGNSNFGLRNADLMSTVQNYRHLQFADGGAMSSFGGRVPGIYDRQDNHLIAVSGDEVVLTPQQWKPIRNYLTAVKVPGFAAGGAVAPSPGSGSSSGGDVIIEELNVEFVVGTDQASQLFVTGAKTADGRKVVVRNVRAAQMSGQL
jgi:hypothetical protein